MRPADVAIFSIGVVVAAYAIVDVFQAVIVPRAPTLRYRISFLVWRALWYLWPRVGKVLYARNAGVLEDFLGIFAPFALISIIVAWVVVLILAFGAMLWALRAGITPPIRSYWDAAYFAGASLLTLGFGDVVGRSGFARVVSLCAGGTGLALFSITTAFLFAIFGTFQRREAFIVMFSARAGSPPSAVGLYEIAANTRTTKHLDPLMREAQNWAASLMESHLAYPMLAYFRSSHDDESWVGTLGALLDASLLAKTVIVSADDDLGEARLFFSVGRHAVRDLADFYEIAPDPDPRIERADFDRACDRLASAGYAIAERDGAWREFARARSEYAVYLDAVAKFFRIPPVAWIGEYRLPHESQRPA